MIGRVLLAALLAGIVAGLVMSVIQHVRLTPIIVAAEVFERDTSAQDHGQHDHGTENPGSSAHSHGDENSWAPQDGWERLIYTTLSTIVTGSAFAAILAGVAMIGNIPLTPRNGVIWGLCGFLCASLAPAAGLPPELPGMPAADLTARQVWWVGCIITTAAGLYLIASKSHRWGSWAGVALIAAPHIIGAPHAVIDGTSGVPAGLAATFVANSLAANAVFWALIGSLLGMSVGKITKELES
jgi:cobalt transporter subunit CbtA